MRLMVDRTAWRSTKWFVAGGMAVVLGLVVFVAPRADNNPDGLETVAADHGLDAGAAHHDLAGSPLARIVGVLLVFAVTYLLVRVASVAARRREASRGSRDVRPAAPIPRAEP